MLPGMQAEVRRELRDARSLLPVDQLKPGGPPFAAEAPPVPMRWPRMLPTVRSHHVLDPLGNRTIRHPSPCSSCPALCRLVRQNLARPPYYHQNQ